MNETIDRSRLPTGEAYWDGLATRIVADGRSVLASYRARSGWAGLLYRWAPALGIAAAASIVALASWLPPAPSDRTGTLVERILGPDDPVGGRFVLSPRPPSAASLIGVVPTRARP